jgi:peptidoglycan/LPS O-acetylase OafA/YrhL
LPADPNPWAGGLETLSFIFGCGWFGVQLFFIISGFILAMPFAEHHLLDTPKISLKKYFLRRVTRLEPPYIVNLTILFAMLIIWPGFRFEGRGAMAFWEYLPHFMASLVYAHNAIYQEMSFINNVAWTLEIEIQFYILAPLLCMVFAVRRPMLRRLIVLAAIFVSAWQSNYYFSNMLNRCIVGQVRYFLLGLLLADIYLTQWKGKPAKTFVWDIFGIAAWLTVPFLMADWKFYLGQLEWLGRSRNFLLPPVLLVAYMAAFRGRLVNKFFSFSWVAAYGGMCYSIYLYHCTVMWMLLLNDVGEYSYFPPGLRRFMGSLVSRADLPALKWTNVAQLVGLAVIVMTCCIPMFLMFEKPFMRRDWPARLSQRIKSILSLPAAIFASVFPQAQPQSEPTGDESAAQPSAVAVLAEAEESQQEEQPQSAEI